MTMKKIMFSVLAIFVSTVLGSCRERPVSFEQLPVAAKTFVSMNFADDKVVLAKLDDDLIRPDYEVYLSSGVELTFNHSGALEKVSSRGTISPDLIPVSIREYVSAHYPTTGYREYEIGRRTYEVTLTNGIELKFNSSFHLVEID